MPRITKLEKPIKRQSASQVYEGKLRPIIITIDPSDRIGFRLKGRQRTYWLPIATCHRIAVEASIEAQKAAKRAAKTKGK